VLDLGIAWQQIRRALVIAGKDIRIYYFKGPVISFGVLFPIFLFLAFAIGRHLTIDFMIPGLLGMILFFTATAISPVVMPWEAQARTLERLMSCPVKPQTIIMGDIIASFAFGTIIAVVPVIIGLIMGITISNPAILTVAIILGGVCFAALGIMFSIPPSNLPATINMIASVVRFPVVFISGIFIALNELPVWGQWIAYISPLTYFTDIARDSIQGHGYLPPVIDFAALTCFTAVFILIAMFMHKKTMPARI
jgi:ABC-2 type transport system permease protein